MEYSVYKNFNIELQNTDKIFFFNFFQSSLELIKEIVTDCTYTSINIELIAIDDSSYKFNSIEDYKEIFYNSSEIKSCTFNVFLYRNSNMKSKDVIISFRFIKNTSKKMKLEYVYVTALSHASATNYLSEIDKQLYSIHGISENTIISTPMEVTSSSNKGTNINTPTKSSQRFTLKQVILICIFSSILTSILTVITGYIQVLLTK